MKLLRSTSLIQYLALAYAVLYILFVRSGDFNGAYPDLSIEGAGVYLLFIVFGIGLSLSWHNKKATGIIFLLWYAGMLFLELIIVEKDGGFGIISGIPVLVFGILFIKRANKTRTNNTAEYK